MSLLLTVWRTSVAFVFAFSKKKEEEEEPDITVMVKGKVEKDCSLLYMTNHFQNSFYNSIY